MESPVCWGRRDSQALPQRDPATLVSTDEVDTSGTIRAIDVRFTREQNYGGADLDLKPVTVIAELTVPSIPIDVPQMDVAVAVTPGTYYPGSAGEIYQRLRDGTDLIAGATGPSHVRSPW
ncbi:MAG: hypothetical protein LBK59_06105 [Bifidobacteriaceae bacterium]|nr:hypothetical protein [Bifidobacteriaceae bacterium]